MIVSHLLRWLRRMIQLLVLAGLALVGFAALRPPPQDLPWTPLRLDQPVGLFTGRKIGALAGDRAACTALLREAGIAFAEQPPRGEGQCKVDNAVRIEPDQQMLQLRPASVAPSCPVAAGLIAWHSHIVEPAARRLLGASVQRIEHFGSYSCRRLYGRAQGSWSEHATANAIDVSGFILSNGRRISVLRDWQDAGPKGAFLHTVRDGGCRLFSTTLSPDYNAAHADHLHMDQADRGATGWGACR